MVLFIEESKDIDALSMDELQSSLLVHEKRMVLSSIDEQALKASTHIDFSTRRRSGRGHGRSRGRGRCSNSRGKAEDVTIIIQPILIQNLISQILSVTVVTGMFTSLSALQICFPTRERSLNLQRKEEEKL